MDFDANVLAPLGVLTTGLLGIAGGVAKSIVNSMDRIALVIPEIQTELKLGREERIELRRQLETERSAFELARREADLLSQIGDLGATVSDRRLEEMSAALKRLAERRRATSDRPSPPPPDSDDPAAPPSRAAPRSTRR